MKEDGWWWGSTEPQRKRFIQHKYRNLYMYISHGIVSARDVLHSAESRFNLGIDVRLFLLDWAPIEIL